MRILHLCLSCFYIDDAGYQENLLVRQHVAEGHKVWVIASTETFDGRGGYHYTEPATYNGADGAIVTRIPYVSWLPHKIARKLRIHPGVYQRISAFKPDVILFHGCSGNELVTVARYAREYPNVVLYLDSHSDYNNSARSVASRRILHGLYYRNRFQRALPVIRKVLCVSTEVIDFMIEVYNAPREKLEFYPLGGFALTEAEIRKRRVDCRSSLGLADDRFVFLQSGKMTEGKKLAESLRAFATLPGDHFRFLIVGLLTEAVRAEIEELIARDPRVSFLGWKTTDELTDLLCAADAYVQPGTQSATMQHALCCGCPVIIDGVRAHEAYLPAGVTLITPSMPLQKALAAAAEWDPAKKQADALSFARERLDYKKQAERILRG